MYPISFFQSEYVQKKKGIIYLYLICEPPEIFFFLDDLRFMYICTYHKLEYDISPAALLRRQMKSVAPPPSSPLPAFSTALYPTHFHFLQHHSVCMILFRE